MSKNFMLHRLCHDFASKVICLTVPKNALGEPFSLSLISGIEKVWMRGWGGGGVSRFSVEIFCLTVPKKFVGEPFSMSLNLDIDKVWMRGWGGVSGFSVENFLSHSGEKFRWATV